jgi:RNA polymerase sigma-70 factor, ECF subfamily
MGTAEKVINSASPGNTVAHEPQSLDLLLQKAKSGDSQAFAEIYDLYAARIFGFISHMVGSRQDAEDVTQDAFFLAYRNLNSLRENAHFEQWLYKIARNEIYKNQRKAKFKPDSLDDTEKGIVQILKSSDPSGNPENKLLSGELGEKIKAIFRSLPMQYKETLVLATLQGLNYQEISGILGRSLSSVKTDVYRARLIISEKIRKYSDL